MLNGLFTNHLNGQVWSSSAEQPARQFADDKDQDIEIMWNDLNTEIHSKSSAAQPAFSYRIEAF